MGESLHRRFSQTTKSKDIQGGEAAAKKVIVYSCFECPHVAASSHEPIFSISFLITFLSQFLCSPLALKLIVDSPLDVASLIDSTSQKR